MDFNDLAFLMGGELPEAEEGPRYRHIWVVAEAEGDGVSRVTRQILGKARELGDRLGVRVECVLLGHGNDQAADALARLGADTVYHLDDPLLATFSADLWVKALAELISDKRPEILLLGFTAAGREVAPRLAQRLGTGLVADASALDLDENERLLIATRESFGGRALATVTCPTARPQMATVHPNAFREAEPDPYRVGDVERISVSLSEGDRRVKLLGTSPLPAETPLERARILVVAGKGVADAEGMGLVKQLAAALGAQVAGTHGAREANLVEPGREVSAQGATVAPDLYLGIGVSGSMGHLDAMRQSRTIVALNTRADAPLMALADYALVGDYREVIPAILETLQQARSKRAATSAR